MPRVAASNGIRPEIRALAVIKLNVPVTPTAINDHVGTGDYAAKYVSFLNTRYGFNIIANKDGRKVVSYTLVAEPSNAAELRGAAPKVAAAPVAKVLPKRKATAKIDAPRKAAASIKAPARSKVRDFDDVTETFGTSGEIATSFSVDEDWDSFDGLDLSKL